jgi:hypothetical protein
VTKRNIETNLSSYRSGLEMNFSFLIEKDTDGWDQPKGNDGLRRNKVRKYDGGTT